MKPNLHPEAEQEVRDAFEYFESRREGLGAEFVHEVDKAIAAASENPGRWPKLGGTVRRCRTNKFPYGIIYHLLADAVEVLAVMDLRRNPGYWRKRLRK